MQEKNEQEQMQDVARRTRERIVEEIPHLQNLIELCQKEHESAIAPLCGMMRSFARFTNSEDNIRILEQVSELFASYAYAKKNKDSLERRNSKTIIQTLKARRDDIETAIRKGMEVDFMFDFFPLMRQYYYLLIRGHKPTNEENDICKAIMSIMGEVAKRELANRYQALESCDKILH